MNSLFLLSHSKNKGGAEFLHQLFLDSFKKENINFFHLFVKKENITGNNEYGLGSGIINLIIRFPLSLYVIITKVKDCQIIFILQEGYHLILSWIIAKISKKKQILWLHSYPTELFKGKIISKIMSKVMADVDKIICVSKDVQNNYNAFTMNKNKNSYVVLPGFNWDYIEKLSSQKSNTNYPIYDKEYVLWLGRLSEEKNPDYILEIGKYIKDNNFPYYISVVGDGPMFHKLKKSIEIKNLKDSVFLEGQLNNPYPLLNNAKVLLSTSCFEGFSLTIIEALYFNIPVIVTNKHVFNRFKHFNNVFYFNEKNHHEILSFISSLNTIYDEKQLVISQYSWKNTYNKIINIVSI